MPALRCLSLTLACALAAIPAAAQDAAAAPDTAIPHYTGEPAETTGQALANFLYFNARVRDVLAMDDIEDYDIERIHEYTYSLEIALAKLNDDLSRLAVTLENLHLASETYDAEMVRAIASVYFATADSLGR